MFSYIHIAPMGQDEYDAATLMSPKDMEDNFQYCAAVSAGCDVIVTRNIKDFPKTSKIKVMMLGEFLDSFASEKAFENEAN